MKKIILFAAFIIGAHCGFAQNNNVSQLTDSTGNAGLKHLFAQKNEVLQFTKEKAIAAVEEAIAIIKANYLYMYFGYPEDTIANISRFIDNINEIVPVSKKKENKIKKLILDKIKRGEKTVPISHVLSSGKWYDWSDFILIMGINADDILWACFNYSDYKKICNKLSKDRINAREAYNYLSTLCIKINYPGKMIIRNLAYSPKSYLDDVFKYYGI